MKLAAPVEMKLTLPEKWSEDAAVFCGMQDGRPVKLADVEIGTEKSGGSAGSAAVTAASESANTDTYTAADVRVSRTGAVFERVGDTDTYTAAAKTTKDADEVTTLTFPVNEAGDTFYIVGGSTKATDGAAAVTSGEGSGAGGSPGTENGTWTGAGTASGQGENGGSPGGSGSGTHSGGQSAGAGASVMTPGAASSGKSGAGKSGAGQKADAHTCTISIDCRTLVNDMGRLKNKYKASFVPKDGWILYPSKVGFRPGDSVYDILSAACRAAGIHMEASYTPMYDSYYIEGINNIYEFDAGDLSGWMYCVNGRYPDRGCSSYKVSDGDTIRFRYTLDLGRDIGGRNALN